MALLNNKIALVTSSTRGIGYYTAKKLASKGAKVYLAVRRLDAGKKIAEYSKNKKRENSRGNKKKWWKCRCGIF